MTEALRSWIIGIAGAAMVTAAAMTITPEGKVKKVVSLVCGLVTVLALIKPVAGFDYTSFSKYLAQYKVDSEEFSSALDDENENLTRAIIEDECEAYILDKGKTLDITDLEAQVTARWSEEGYWYPGGVRLITDADAQARDKLSKIIQAELGISPEELIWSMRDEE